MRIWQTEMDEKDTESGRTDETESHRHGGKRKLGSDRAWRDIQWEWGIPLSPSITGGKEIITT